MDNYVLALKSRRGLTIGRKIYGKSGALVRLKELKAIGINMEIMKEQNAFSPN